MSRLMSILFALLTIVLVAAGTVHQSATAPAATPENAVQSMLRNVKVHNWAAAYSYLAPGSNVELQDFQRDLQHSENITYEDWRHRPVLERAPELLGWVLQREQ